MNVNAVQRFAYTLLALVLGVGIVMSLSYAGEKSKGPIENLLTEASAAVVQAEETGILQQREYKRADRLDWFAPLRTNKAALRNPPKMLLGAYDNLAVNSFETITSLEDSLQTVFPLIHVYSAWGSKEEQAFPKLQVRAIMALGSTPVVTWEPWLNDFSAAKIPNLRPLEQRDQGGLLEVANGVYDSYMGASCKSCPKTPVLAART
jgi:hypothetical protein